MGSGVLAGLIATACPMSEPVMAEDLHGLSPAQSNRADRTQSGRAGHDRRVRPGDSFGRLWPANTAMQRDPWSFNLFEVPRGRGPACLGAGRGNIVTNYHVIYGADSITVTLADRTEIKAKVVGADPDHDIAVLQIQAPESVLQPVTIGNSQALRRAKVWRSATPSARPYADDRVVSALGRTIKSMSNPGPLKA